MYSFILDVIYVAILTLVASSLNWDLDQVAIIKFKG